MAEGTEAATAALMMVRLVNPKHTSIHRADCWRLRRVKNGLPEPVGQEEAQALVDTDRDGSRTLICGDCSPPGVQRDWDALRSYLGVSQAQ